MINFDNVTKVYPNQSRPALESVNISVAKGEFVFLVGPSGSGKSTFLRLVLKEERPSEGRIHVAGRDLARLTNWKVPYLRRRIGCVFQDFRLLPNKSVYQNVAFALEVIGKPRRFIPFLGSGTGGSSALYGMVLERFFPQDFTPRRNFPQSGDSSLPESWPIRYELGRPRG